MDPVDGEFKLNLQALHSLSQPPELFSPGLPLWDDPHISQQMLNYHLDPESEAASRPLPKIDASAEWLVKRLGLIRNSPVLDLGCGPGLYAERLARHDVRVTGLDISRSSIDYARRRAQAGDLPIIYRIQNFMTIDYTSAFDAVLQIFGEINTLPPRQRDDLLSRIHRALKPHGVFAFDVSTPAHRAKEIIGTRWYTVPEGGFWKPGPHLVLEESYTYDGDIHLDQFVVVEADSMVSVYRTWFLDYTPETIRNVVEAAGFIVEDLYADLCGTPLPPDKPTEWIGVVARKK